MTARRLAVIFACVLSACVSEPPGGPLIVETDNAQAVSVIQNINELGQRCWVKSGDRNFADLRLIPEIDTHAGRPRILLTKRNRGSSLPQLVIEAAGDPVRIETYGPLTSASISRRINRDIERWSTGDGKC